MRASLTKVCSWVTASVLLLSYLGTEATGAITAPAKCLAAKERIRRSLAVDEPHVRKRRTLYVPQGTNWELQWSMNLPFETQNRYGSKIQLAIPMYVDFPAIWFDDNYKDKLKGKYEEEVEHHYSRSGRSLNYTKAIQGERLHLYKNIEGLFDKLGLPARDCLLRTICEVAQDPMENGIMGDVLNLFLSPSVASVSSEDHGELEEFVRAEKTGQVQASCHQHYHSCPASLFHLIPAVVNNFFSR